MKDKPTDPENQSNKKDRHFHGWIPIVPPNGRYHGGNPYFPFRDSYSPWYDDKTDYNTNAKSYYDYLARYNKFIISLMDFVNHLEDRNIDVNDTSSVQMIKDGDWWENEENCNFDWSNGSIEHLSANVKISSDVEQIDFGDDLGVNDVPNATSIHSDGLWSGDYQDVIKKLANENKALKDAIQKILNNLYEAGAITNNNINEYQFVDGRHIANGNINLFSKQADGEFFIKTSNNQTEGDVVSGLKE